MAHALFLEQAYTSPFGTFVTVSAASGAWRDSGGVHFVGAPTQICLALKLKRRARRSVPLLCEEGCVMSKTCLGMGAGWG
jgi:hypothetical protein